MNRSPGPGFAVLYRWRLKPEKDQQFIEAWSRISAAFLTERGSLGSRLHLGTDGLWYSYAQWPSPQVREDAFSLPPVDPEAAMLMRDAIMETLPEIVLNSVSDFMVLPKKSGI